MGIENKLEELENLKVQTAAAEAKSREAVDAESVRLREAAIDADIRRQKRKLAEAEATAARVQDNKGRSSTPAAFSSGPSAPVVDKVDPPVDKTSKNEE